MYSRRYISCLIQILNSEPPFGQAFFKLLRDIDKIVYKVTLSAIKQKYEICINLSLFISNKRMKVYRQSPFVCIFFCKTLC